MSVYDLLRPLLFALEPERAHGLSLRAAQLGGALAPGLVHALVAPRQAKAVQVAGLQFPNALGVAAGYDKDGLAWRGLAAMGFGHVEVGTVTPLPQPGNPRPRVFRLPEDRGVINRLGFPSQGAEAVLKRLGPERPYGAILGVNLGKNKDTPIEEAERDYVSGVRSFAALADYLVVNVSSPNTPQLRALQTGERLRALLVAVRAARDEARTGRPCPLFVKLAPDLDESALDDAVGAIVDAGCDGVVATNTTLSREGLRSAHASEAGGLSGAPLTGRALEILRGVVARAGGLAVVAAGGIMSADDAKARLDAGASLVQVYTGLIYRGPGLVREIVEAL